MMVFNEYLPTFLSILFVVAGATKVIGLPFQKREFKHWNLPRWMMYSTGATEVLAGAMMYFDSFTYIGAIVGAFIMLGAMLTLWMADERARSGVPLVFLLLCAYSIWQTSPDNSLKWIVLGIIGVLLIVAFPLWFYRPTPENKHGELEKIAKNCSVTHYFEETLGVRYHYVVAGNKQNPTVVMIHGFPESWYCFHAQIAALADQYYVIALDLKPYGQTGKDLDGDHSYPHISEEIKALLDQIEVEKFHLIAHDRGSVVSDHLLSKNGMQKRVLSYIRMQQSFNEPHGKPEPPHKLMRAFPGSLAFSMRFFMEYVYKLSPLTSRRIPKSVLKRIKREFQFKHIALAAPLSFKTTSFAKELEDRHNFLFKTMTVPMLLLQGRLDPGQHPEEYENAHSFVSNGQVEFIEAGHFFHVEAPEETNEAIIAFLLSQ